MSKYPNFKGLMNVKALFLASVDQPLLIAHLKTKILFSVFFLLILQTSEMKARGRLRRCPEVTLQSTSSRTPKTRMVARKMATRLMMKTRRRMITTGTPLRRLVHGLPVRTHTACPPCPSQQWPPPTPPPTCPTTLTSWDMPTSRLCLATSPPCQVSRSRHRLHPVTPLEGSMVRQSTSESSKDLWEASCWRPPPLPWTRTSWFLPRTSPPPPPACLHLGWTTLAAHPPSRRPLRPHPVVTCPHIVTCHPVPDISRPGETSLLSDTSRQRRSLGHRGDTAGTSPQGGDTSPLSPRCLGPRPQEEETSNATFRHRAATGG